MAAAPKVSSSKSPALKGVAGLLLAALAWLAHQLGWIDLGDGAQGDAGAPDGGAVREAPREDEPEARPPAPVGTTKDRPRASDYAGGRSGSAPAEDDQPPAKSADDGSAEIARLFRARRSDVQVTGFARVRAVLPDDDEGSRHQKFLLEFPNGHTLLVAHNIDLAPRVPLERGDTVHFHGEYEWTDKGGVLHWTHHDPAGRHPGGWLELDGERYQ